MLALGGDSRVPYLSHEDNLVPDGVLNVSKEIERAGSNHAQEEAAFAVFTRSLHPGRQAGGGRNTGGKCFSRVV
jgi:hypothetical protein